MVASPLLDAEDGLELGQLLGRRIRAQVVVAVEPEERGDQVVEEAAVVGGGHVLVAGRGELVLVDALDAHFLGGDGGMLAHRQPGAGLAVGGDLDADRGGQLADELEPVDVRLGPAQPEQHAAQVVAEGDGCVRRGVHAARGAGLVLTQRDGVGDGDGGLEPGAAGLLQVIGRRVRIERRAEHALAHQVEVAAVLEHGAADHGAKPFAGQVEPVDQPVQGCGEHVLVGCVGVCAVGAGEGNSVATEDRYSAGGLVSHSYLSSLTSTCRASYYPRFLLWSKFVIDTTVGTPDLHVPSFHLERQHSGYRSVLSSRQLRPWLVPGQATRRPPATGAPPLPAG